MSATAPCSNRVIPLHATSQTSRVAGWLHALALYLERRKTLRARRRLAHRAAQDIRQLSDSTLHDLGIRREQAGRVGDGMLGPPHYWRGFSGRF